MKIEICSFINKNVKCAEISHFGENLYEQVLKESAESLKCFLLNLSIIIIDQHSVLIYKEVNLLSLLQKLQVYVTSMQFVLSINRQKTLKLQY